jgi:hypothetical protein
VTALAAPPFAALFPFHLAATLTIVIAAAVPAWHLAAPRLLALRGRALGAIGGALALAAGATVVIAGGRESARAGIIRSPAMRAVATAVRAVTDVDRDGASSILGGGDCRPFDGAVHPGARDLPGDGIDQNCRGGDYVRQPPPSPAPDAPVPPALLEARPSVLLVTIDTLRRDHVGFAGYARPTTPALDALAARGAWFDAAYSTGSYTVGVLPTLVTSRTMDELAFGEKTRPGGFPARLLPEATTLAEALAGAGLRGAMFTSYPFFDGWGLDQGFEHVVNAAWDEARPTAPRLTDEALAWLRTLPAGDRFFLWIHYQEPHAPYLARTTRFGETAVDRYDSEIRFVDDELGRLLRAIDPARTIVVVTSDHGETIGDVSGGHAGLSEEVLRVPLAIAAPGLAPRRLFGLVSLLDVAPTICALAGVTAPPAFTGRALVAAVVEGREEPERLVFASDARAGLHAVIASDASLTWRERDDVATVTGPAGRRPVLEVALHAWRERVLDREW